MGKIYSNLVLFGNRVFLKDETQVKITDVVEAHPLKEKFFFVEVGANDGVSNDPIRDWVEKYNWEGVLIEPVETAFVKLMKNYEGIKGVYFEKVAISDSENDTALLYVPKASKVASLNKNHPPAKGKKDVVRTKLSTLDKIVEKYSIDHIDLLNIDAEGHDFNVIKSLDLDKHKTRIIHYEHRHLSKDEKKECEYYLKRNMYELYFNRNNTIAINVHDEYY